MSWIDWTIVLFPLFIVAFIGMKAQKYVNGVADFLTAGRVAGRYVLGVASDIAGMGLISLVAIFESYYKSGFAYGFWGSIATPVLMILALTGYCIYRFRETRAMTIGQFLEIRYSRSFRLFAGILQSISGIINYALFPAVSARFLVYFCGLPVQFELFGYVFPTFAVVMAIFLSIAVFIVTMGGQITVMVTDCIQGILSYPMYMVVVLFIMVKFSWFKDLSPVLLDRPKGQSLLNPFDITELRDFNLFYVIVGMFSSILNRMGWSGSQGYNTAARNAHEQKMAAILGTWRTGFAGMMYILLAVVAFCYLNSEQFRGGKEGSVACRTELGIKSIDDVLHGDGCTTVKHEALDYIKTGHITPKLQAMLDKTAQADTTLKVEKEKRKYIATDAETEKPQELSVEDKARVAKMEKSEERFNTAKDALRSLVPGKAQTCNTIFGQMRVPMALRYILPTGIMGVFCALCVFLLISTDTTYLHSWGSILVQDVILPIRGGKPFTPKQQLRLLRLLIASVAVFAFFFSYFFGQVDYILMFFAITGAIWLGGSGPCIVGGMYWKRGTTTGAWCALISGSFLAVLGILLQTYWADNIYPWLYAHNMVETAAVWLQKISYPFEPIIKWRMNSEKFPINSQEIFAISMIVSVSLYVVISLITCRVPFNMDRMLHRGKYHREGIQLEKMKWSVKNVFVRLMGIDNQYTRGDKILAWSVFIYSFGWTFGFCFLGITIWNFMSPWTNHGWSLWFFIQYFCVALVIGFVSTIWFTIGGSIDLRRLFRDLKTKKTNVLDDGRVIDNVSADDIEMVEKIDQVEIREAHLEEELLCEELKDDGDTDDLKNLEMHIKNE